jgi:hypothetical protein
LYVQLLLTPLPKRRDPKKATKLKSAAQNTAKSSPGNSVKRSSRLLRKTETEFE